MKDPPFFRQRHGAGKEREEALDESKVRMKLALGEWRRRGVEKEINEEHPVLAFP